MRDAAANRVGREGSSREGIARLLEWVGADRLARQAAGRCCGPASITALVEVRLRAHSGCRGELTARTAC